MVLQVFAFETAMATDSFDIELKHAISQIGVHKLSHVLFLFVITLLNVISIKVYTYARNHVVPLYSVESSTTNERLHSLLSFIYM